MTVIIASLFLPYTVKFEIESHEGDNISELYMIDDKNATERIHPSFNQQEGVPSSIISSLGNLQSYSGSPVIDDSILGSSSYKSNMNSTDDLFHHRAQKMPSDYLASAEVENSERSSYHHLVQPKSRFSKLAMSGSVVEPKTELEEGLPSISVNMSTSNVSSLAQSPTGSLTPLKHNALNARTPKINMKKLNGAFIGSNSYDGSGKSAVLGMNKYGGDDYSSGSVEHLHLMANDSSDDKLAPYGGFSKPNLKEQILNESSIFDTAPWKVERAGKGNGSLIKAVQNSAEAGIITNRKWVGTISMPSDAISKNVQTDIAKTLADEYNSEAVFPSDLVFNGFYKSYCKQILWPSFHYQIPDDPKSKAFEDHSWGYYKQVNQMIADKVVETYLSESNHEDPENPENVIWVHDYHLLLVPLMIREKLPNAKIGFFLHISFPSSEVFRCFAHRKQLLKGLLAANSIAFQTEEYVRHFLQTCNGLLLADVNEFGVSYNDHVSLVTMIPVGVDSNSLLSTVASDSVMGWRTQIREKWKNQKLIVSKDNLDKIRGIKQKLLAYEKFLINNPEYIEETILIQICPEKTEDKVYESEVLTIVDRINSLTSEISFSQPVVLLQQDIEFEQYIALQSEADLFVVSSMREGLNLSCHEYIIATTEKKSPLMLSEFAGSSTLLNCHGKGALLINPWDLNKFANFYKISLEMTANERLSRWRNCYEKIVHNDSKNWLSKCLKSIHEAWNHDRLRSHNSSMLFTKSVFKRFYSSSNGKRIFLLNLETPSAVQNVTDSGNLQQKDKTSYIVSPSKLNLLLGELMCDPNNDVYIISLMKRSEMDVIFKRIPNIGLISENGGYIKLVGTNKWISIVDESELHSWMPQVSKLVQSKADRLSDSHMEVGDCTIRLYAHESNDEEKEKVFDVIGGLVQHINILFQDQLGVHATLIKNVVILQQDKLALKALKFLISYYNRGKDGIEREALAEQFQVKPVSNSAPTTPSSISFSDISSPKYSSEVEIGERRVGSLFLAGGATPIDEPVYEYAKSLKESGVLDDVLTVSAMDDISSTSANYICFGRYELLVTISEISKEHT